MAKERRSWKEKWQRLWSNHTSIQSFHCRLSSSQTHPDCSWSSQQPSCDLVSVLHCLVSWMLPRSLSFHYSCVFIHHLSNATWLAHQHSCMWNENGIGRSPDHGLGTRLTTSHLCRHTTSTVWNPYTPQLIPIVTQYIHVARLRYGATVRTHTNMTLLIYLRKTFASNSRTAGARCTVFRASSRKIGRPTGDRIFYPFSHLV